VPRVPLQLPKGLTLMSTAVLIFTKTRSFREQHHLS